MRVPFRKMAHRIFSLWEKFDRKIGNPKVKVGIFVAALFALQIILARKVLAAGAVDMAAYFATGGPLGQMVIIIITMLLIGILYMALIFDMMLTYLVIMVASYNNFVNAAAVVTGWPLVRDVVNMFFIVVLLVIAFGTIIGYKEFDYKKYVPRLLLMAVLINFSKTLVGLLIDFSQVIMLTFVNGFKDAAFGNFIKAFGMDKVLTLATGSANMGLTGQGAAAGIAQETQLMTAAIFGLGMLTITGTVLLIMLIYLIARVIGLWAILIFAPLAFFIWALPPKLQKSVSQYSTEWWSKLGALLAGGPIMAFFLWLTLAIVSANDAPFGDFLNKGGGELDYLKAAISQAASLDNVARFVVATAFLLMGVQAAVSISKSVGGGLGNIASKISSKGGPIGVPLRAGARAAGAGARGAGRLAGAGVKYGGRLAVGKYAPGVGQKLLTGGEQLAARGGVLGGLAGGLVGGAGAKFLGAAGKVRAEEAEKVKKATAGMGPGQRAQMRKIKMAGAMSDLEKSEITKSELRDYENADTAKYKKDQFKDANRAAFAATLSGDPAFAGVAPTDPKFTAELDARLGAAAEQSALDEWEKSDPRLLPPDKLKAEMRKAKPGDVSPKTLQSLDAARALLEAQCVIQNGAVVANPENTEFMKYAKKRGGDYYAYVQNAMGNLGKPEGTSFVRNGESFIEVSPTGSVSSSSTSAARQQQISSAISGAGLAPTQVAEFSGRMSAVPTPTQASVLTAAASAGAYDTSRATFTGPQAESMASVQRSGMPSSVAFNYDPSSGAYANVGYSTAHFNETQNAMDGLTSTNATEVAESVGFIANIDPAAFSSGGAVTANVTQAVEGKMKNFVTVMDRPDVTAEQVAKLQSVVKAAAQAGAKAIEKRSRGEAVNPVEEAQIRIHEEIMNDKRLRSAASSKR